MFVSSPRGSEVANTLSFIKSSRKTNTAAKLKPKAIAPTLTILSHPALTITGFWGFGLNRTQDTHSVWPLSVMVNLQSPSVFHSLMVRSREPETIWRLSAEKDTESTSLVWPTKRRVVTPVESSHRRRVLSQDEESAYAPSEEMTYNQAIISSAIP